MAAIPVINGGTGANDAPTARTNLGITLNSSRSYSSQSLTFNTPRTPNSTHDTLVIASVQMSVTVLQTSTISVEIDFGSGYVIIGTMAVSGVAITDTKMLSFVVPSNYPYKIVSSGTGSNSIVSSYELTL